MTVIVSLIGLMNAERRKPQVVVSNGTAGASLSRHMEIRRGGWHNHGQMAGMEVGTGSGD